jgi:hypothetical protein
MEQSILRAQQQILTDVEQARRAGIARTFVPGHGAGTTVLAWWNPTQE